MLESDMSPAVEAWLVQSGFGVVREPSLPVNGTCRRPIDLVGWTSHALVAVELKLRLDGDLARQCASCSYGADLVYACVPAEAWDDASKCASDMAVHGVGVLLWSPGVDGGTVAVKHEPIPWYPAQARRNEWMRRLARAHNREAGGLKGSDIGARTLEQLRAYAREAAETGVRASWRAAFRKVDSTCDNFVELRTRYRKALCAEGVELANG